MHNTKVCANICTHIRNQNPTCLHHGVVFDVTVYPVKHPPLLLLSENAATAILQCNVQNRKKNSFCTVFPVL